MYQLFHTSRPGALDTSLVSTDNINNPRTMNAVYSLGARLEHRASGGARRRSPAASSTTSSSTTSSATGPLTEFFEQAGHGLDAARAQGRLRFGRRARRAQSRLPQHRPVQRGVAAALQRRSSAASRSRRSRSPWRSKNSSYWQATEAQTPRHGAVLPQGRAARTPEGRAGRRAVPDRRRRPRSTRGKVVFAETLRALPFEQAARSRAAGLDPAGCAGPDYLQLLEQLLGLDQDRRVQATDARDRAGAGLPRRQLPVDRGRACR